MAHSREDIAELYVAFFKRATDSAGLTYWIEQQDMGMTMEQISESFFDQAETQAKYPSSLSNAEFIVAIYNNVFNHGPDTAGMDYWVDELNAGHISRADMILAVVNGALDDDAFMLQNKTTVGLAFADAGLSDQNQAISIMSGITADYATVEAAVVQIDEWADQASTQNFTALNDILNGTDGNDIFSGNWNTNENDSIYQSFDRVTGGEGANFVGGGAAGATHAYQDAANTLYVDINQNNIFNAADDLVINAGAVVAAGDLFV